MHLELGALIVADYDDAIRFFVDALGFELVEDSAALTNDGRPKRWVVVRPPGAVSGLLLARADGPEQRSLIGRQFAGRVGFFLRVDDFDETYRRWQRAGVEFVGEPRDERYGRVVVFRDVAGNRWESAGAGADDPTERVHIGIHLRRPLVSCHRASPRSLRGGRERCRRSRVSGVPGCADQRAGRTLGWNTGSALPTSRI